MNSLNWGEAEVNMMRSEDYCDTWAQLLSFFAGGEQDPALYCPPFSATSLLSSFIH